MYLSVFGSFLNNLKTILFEIKNISLLYDIWIYVIYFMQFNIPPNFIIIFKIMRLICFCFILAAAPVKEGEAGYKDWVFINYTYKRFEGLTQRGLVRPSKQKWASLRTFTCDRRQKEGCGNERQTISSRTFGDDRRWLIYKQGKRMVSHFYLFLHSRKMKIICLDWLQLC